MQRFDLTYQLSSPYTPPPGNVPSSIERRDERSDSQSDSEDGHNAYLRYTDQSQKSDIDPEEDLAGTALTSQTLNADGTPKRPMNAFMIFARRRRPQVSAENQSMRTGEISKILSKEWNTMEMTEKQFYLDQAKQLKETFNSKYPDYVYRRRPNNSRKRRRTEGGVDRSLDIPHHLDRGDDISGSEIFGEPSPIDADDGLSETAADLPYTRASAAFGDHNCLASQMRTLSYTYPVAAEIPRHAEPQEIRLSHLSAASDRISHRTASVNQVASTRPAESQYPYVHAQPSNLYSTDHTAANGNWDSRVGTGRFVTPDWTSGQQRCPVPSSNQKAHSYTSANASQPSSWSGAAAPSINPTTSATQGANYPFPTLNSPFYPQASQMEGSYQNTQPSSAVHAGSAMHYNTSQIQLQDASMSARHLPQYDGRSYASPSPVRYSAAFAPDHERTGHLYSQPQPRPALPRSHSTLQPPIPSFTQSHSPPNKHNHSVSSQLGFWSRDKSG